LEARQDLASAGTQQSRGGSGLNRWRQIEELYNAARELDPGARGRYLHEACPDEELRGEVESLLGCDAEAEDFLESPALEVTAEALAEGRTRTMVGRVLGAYQIVSFLGAGGMGEVYRARDSRIGRDVAIKLLPPDVAADPERLRRFEQEARATGALNHPNILAIHDVGFEDGAPYVVYELLDGETLRERLRHGSLPRRKALDHARQIALGLAAAHEKFITHRDLKPENLFLTRDGRVKILDFGLAKLSRPGQTVAAHDIPPSQSYAASTPGTPGYMAPEQVRAGVVDHRSDLFNLGAVLCEMLTGSAPFRGRSTGEVLRSILKDDPVEAMETGENFDPGLSRLLRRCLEKDPNERIQSAQDLAFDIETLLLPPARARQPGRKKIVIALALAAVVLVIASFFTGRKLESALAHPTPTFHRLTYRAGVITGARFAPGGQSVIYSAAWDGKPVETFTARIGGPESRPLGLLSAGALAVSSAGELALSLGCELNWAECRGTLARMPLAGGAPREVLENVYYADWSPDGKNLAVVRAADGRVRLEYPIGKVLYEAAGWITYPRVSPKGDRIAFLDHPALGENDGSVAIVDLNGHKTVLSSGWKNLKGLAWSPKEDEVWFSGDRIKRSQLVYAVTLSGKVRLVLQAPGWMRLQEISRDGRVLVLQADPRSRIMFQPPGASPERDLSWFDWSTVADLSPDGKKLLFYEWGEGVAGNPTVYLRDTSGGDAIRLGEGRALALSPDGKFALALQAGSPPALVLLPTGTGEEKRLPASDLTEYYSAAWFPDGKRILFVAAGSDAQPHSYIQNLEGGAAVPIGDEMLQRAALVSPDEKLLAGITSSGDYVLGPIDGGSPRPIRGALPGDELIQWSRDGRSLYVCQPGDSSLEFFRVDLATGRREPWKSVKPADTVGMIGIQGSAVHMTPDGRSVAYSYWKTLTELYLVDNLK
jgi:serine/threonine protein kinase/Tol biopolymer transport system component